MTRAPVTMTAKEMALTSHNLSNSAMNATTKDGRKFRWSDAQEMWIEIVEVKQAWYLDAAKVAKMTRQEFAVMYAATMTKNKKGREIVEGYQIKVTLRGYQLLWNGKTRGYGVMDADSAYSWMNRTPLVHYSNQAEGIRCDLLVNNAR